MSTLDTEVDTDDIRVSNTAAIILTCILSIVSLVTACIATVFCIKLINNVCFADLNWIIQPSKKSKLAAIACISIILLSSYIFIPYYLVNVLVSEEIANYFWYASNIVGSFRYRFYYFYLLFNIQDEMKQNKIIQHAIQNIVVHLLTIAIVIDFVWCVVYDCLRMYIIYSGSNGLPDVDTVDIIYGIIETVILDGAFLFIYVRSLRIYANWWRQKCWQESEKYGITQREHEVLIRITRFTVICSMTALIDIISNLLDQYLYYDVSMMVWILSLIFDQMVNVVLVSSIYFSFEFGYDSYLKVYGKCHTYCYERSASKSKNIQDKYVKLENQ